MTRLKSLLLGCALLLGLLGSSVAQAGSPIALRIKAQMVSPEPPCDITVSTSATLNTQANSLANDGKVVCVSPGTYTLLTITAVHVTDVVIRSADYNNMAVIKGIEGPSSGSNARHFYFKKLQIITDLTRISQSIRTNGDSDLTFDSNDITDVDQVNFTHGTVRLVNGSNVTMINNVIHDAASGIIVSGVTGLYIRYNTIRDTHFADAMQIETSSTVYIEHNFVTRMSTTGVHPDALQFLTTNATAANAGNDIHVNYNLYCRGVGFFSAQGFPFMGNESYTSKSTRYTNVEIIGNVNIGAQFGGISLDGAINFVVQDNLVRGWTDQQSWIRVIQSDAGDISNNTTTNMNNGTGGLANTNTTVANNTIIAQADTPVCETQP